MAELSPSGDPNLRALINGSGGPGGAFHVRDVYGGGTNVFTVNDDGTVIFNNSLKSGSYLVFDNTNGGTQNDLVRFARNGTDRVTVEQNATNGYASVLAVTSGWGMRLTGETADLNTVNSTGVISNFRTNGTSRMTVEYDSTNTIMKFQVVGGSDKLRLTGDEVQLNTDNSSGTIATFHTNGTSRLTVEYTSSKPRITAASSADIDLTGSTSDLLLKAGREITFQMGVDSSVGQFRVANGSGSSLLTIGETGRTSWYSGAGVRCYGFFEPSDGGGDTGTTTLEVGEDSSRGNIVLRADTTAPTNQQGIIQFEPQETAATKRVFLYVWYDVTTNKNQLLAHDIDPGSSRNGDVGEPVLIATLAAT